MAYKAIINGGTYAMRDGFPITYNLDKTLDTGTVIIKTDEKIVFYPYDLITIKNDDDFYEQFLIDAFDETEVSYDAGGAIKWQYQIKIISETKALERIILPKLRITQSKIAAARRSVGFYIRQYVKEYAPMIRVKYGTTWLYARKWTIDNALLAIADTVICPEFQFNNRNLREVLTALGSVLNFIIVLKNNIITFYDITERGNSVTAPISVETAVLTAADYVSDLDVTLENLLADTDTDTDNITRVVEYTGFRNPDEAVLDSDNGKIVLGSPIYNIKSVVIGFVVRIATTSNNEVASYDYYIEQDITKHILEKMEWDTLSAVPPALGGSTFTDRSQWYRKPMTAYYNRGSDTIEGFVGGFYKKNIFANEDMMYFLLRAIAWQNGFATIHGIDMTPHGNNIALIVGGNSDVVFRIEYESLATARIKAGRYLPSKNEFNSVVDNQPDSYASAAQFGLLEYLKVSRLGNKIRIINGKVKFNADLPRLADTIGDYVLSTLEVQRYDNYIKWRGVFAENYALLNFFTDVMSKARSWQILASKDASVRHDIIKYYIEYSNNAKYDYLSYTGTDYPASYWNSAFYNSSPSKLLKHAIVYTRSYDNTRYPAVGLGYETDLSKKVIGNSILLTTGFNDNFTAGQYVIGATTGGVLLGMYKYADENGENSFARVSYASYITPSANEITGQWFSDGQQLVRTSDWELAKTHSNSKPLINNAPNNTIEFVSTNDHAKDNAEILRLTTQIEYCADDSGIVIGPKMAQLQDAVASELKTGYVIRGSKTSYIAGRYIPSAFQDISGGLTIAHLLKYTYNDYTVKFVFQSSQHSNIAEYLSIAIEYNGELVIAWNKKTVDGAIWANFKLLRNDDIYNSQADQRVIGTIDGTTATITYTSLPPAEPVPAVLPNGRVIINVTTL